MELNKTTIWLLFALLVIIEAGWAMTLKYAATAASPWVTAFGCLLAVADALLLAKVFAIMPVGSAYALWVGSSAILIAILGVIFFKEALTPQKMVFITLIVGGIIGLQSS